MSAKKETKIVKISSIPKMPQIHVADLDGIVTIAEKLNKPILLIEDAQMMDHKLPVSKVFSAHYVMDFGVLYVNYFNIKKEE